jgi:hypothetical protein
MKEFGRNTPVMDVEEIYGRAGTFRFILYFSETINLKRALSLYQNT